MIAFRIALYVLTLAVALFFAFWERKVRGQLTDEALGRLEKQDNASDFGAFYGIREEFRRERILNGLPREALFKYRAVVGLKLLFFVILVVEVLVLQR